MNPEDFCTAPTIFPGYRIIYPRTAVPKDSGGLKTRLDFFTYLHGMLKFAEQTLADLVGGFKTPNFLVFFCPPNF